MDIKTIELIHNLGQIAGLVRRMQDEYHGWYRATQDHNKVRKYQHMAAITRFQDQINQLVERPRVKWIYLAAQQGKLSMPELEDIFGGQQSSLKAADLEKGSQYKYKIKGVTVQTFKQTNDMGEEYEAKKPVLTFVEIDKTFVCNRGNATTISEIVKSTNTDQWVGQEITLFHDPSVIFRGKKGAIRVAPFS